MTKKRAEKNIFSATIHKVIDHIQESPSYVLISVGFVLQKENLNGSKYMQPTNKQFVVRKQFDPDNPDIYLNITSCPFSVKQTIFYRKYSTDHLGRRHYIIQIKNGAFFLGYEPKKY
ncbi:hypothetical protein AGMMS50249_8010 [candidate division SR1 bacterium]|nr:hypothetical protein AGMMS50249_8010 [candidate division SR1 bacterium]